MYVCVCSVFMTNLTIPSNVLRAPVETGYSSPCLGAGPVLVTDQKKKSLTTFQSPFITEWGNR